MRAVYNEVDRGERNRMNEEIMTYEDLYYEVKETMQWDQSKTDRWFFYPNPLIQNFTPYQFYKYNPKRCKHFIMSVMNSFKDIEVKNDT